MFDVIAGTDANFDMEPSSTADIETPTKVSSRIPSVNNANMPDIVQGNSTNGLTNKYEAPSSSLLPPVSTTGELDIKKEPEEREPEIKKEVSFKLAPIRSYFYSISIVKSLLIKNVNTSGTRKKWTKRRKTLVSQVCILDVLIASFSPEPKNVNFTSGHYKGLHW